MDIWATNYWFESSKPFLHSLNLIEKLRFFFTTIYAATSSDDKNSSKIWQRAPWWVPHKRKLNLLKGRSIQIVRCAGCGASCVPYWRAKGLVAHLSAAFPERISSGNTMAQPTHEGRWYILSIYICVCRLLEAFWVVEQFLHISTYNFPFSHDKGEKRLRIHRVDIECVLWHVLATHTLQQWGFRW